jgi:transposase InsO family protein
VTRGSIEDYAAAVRGRYLAASREGKKRILDEFCAATGYHRKAVVRLLRRGPTLRARKAGRPRCYGPEVGAPLAVAWEALGRPCGKRLQPFLPELVGHLERHGELVLEPGVRELLCRMSASTIDRLMQRYRRRSVRRPWTQSAGEESLRQEVTVRTFGEWQGVAPGALQADLVAHCGGSVAGFYLTTLLAVDVATGWCELEAVWGKGQHRVGSAVHRVRQRLPFPLRALHTDNGGEFLNHLLVPWCRREGVVMTRGRPYRKNDQAYAEQKNDTAVRRIVGYLRLSSEAAYRQLQRVYRLENDYLNFFQPVGKLLRKSRSGARVTKVYDQAKTPYQRVLLAGVADEAKQAELAERYQQLNPVRLRRELEEALRRLWMLAQREVPSVTPILRQAEDAR